MDKRLAGAVLALVLVFFGIVVLGQQYRVFHEQSEQLEHKITWQESNYTLPVLPEPGPKVAALLGVSLPSGGHGSAPAYVPYPNTSPSLVERLIAQRNYLWARVRAALPTASDIDAIQASISRLATVCHVQRLQIEGARVRHVFYRTTDLQLRMTGTLKSLRATLRDIDHLPRMKSWGKVSLRRTGRDRGTVSVHLFVYATTLREPTVRRPVHLASCTTAIHGVWLPWLYLRLSVLQERYRQVCQRQSLNPALALKYRELRRPDILRSILDGLNILSKLQKTRRPLDLTF